MNKALILVDLQNDFMPGGALEIRSGHEVVPVANKLIQSGIFTAIVATQDWHPKNHKSFSSNNPGTKVGEEGELNGVKQVWWPDHCVQGTKGADFHKDLNINKVNAIFRKGSNPEIDSYSAFRSNGNLRSYNFFTGLRGYLDDLRINHVYILGLALDYCVRYTAIDSIRYADINTSVVLDGCRAVDDNDIVEYYISEMKEIGISFVESSSII